VPLGSSRYTQHRTPYTQHITPYTIHITPCTLHITPYTPHPTLYDCGMKWDARRATWLKPVPNTPQPAPCTLHFTHYTLRPTHHTPHYAPYTLRPAPHTLHLIPYTPQCATYTLHPTLCTFTLSPTPYSRAFLEDCGMKWDARRATWLKPVLTPNTLHLTPGSCWQGQRPAKGHPTPCTLHSTGFRVNSWHATRS
jgi:hypothetical protein